MGDYVSYSTYVPPEESQETPYIPPVVRDTGSTASVVIRDGAVSYADTQNNHSIKSSDLTPFDSEDWRAGAKKPNGFPAQTITEDTIVRLAGTEGQVKHFVAAGLLKETANGFELADAIEEAPQAQEDLSDTPGMPEDLVTAMDAAMEVFDDKTLEAGLSLGIAHLTGDVDFNAVVRKLAMGSGKEPSDVQQRAQFVMDSLQAQADTYLAKQGIGKEDLSDFYEFAKTRKGDLMAAVNKQVRQGDLSHYKPLISKFLSSTAPSLQSLQAAGFETRTADKQAQVRINNSWMSVQAAARANLI